MGFSGDRCSITFIFSIEPRHVTPQIDRLEKTSTVLRVFKTHLWGSQEIDLLCSAFSRGFHQAYDPSALACLWKNEWCSDGLDTLVGGF